MTRRSTFMSALQKLCDYHQSQGVPLGDSSAPPPSHAVKKGDFAGAIIIAPALDLCRDMGRNASRTRSSVFCQRLDDGARACAPTRRGTAAGHSRTMWTGRN